MTRAENLLNYLEKCVTDSCISADVRTTALHYLQALDAEVGNKLPVPDANPGPDGSVLLTWNYDNVHFEFEVLNPLTIELFWHNRSTHKSWGKTTKLGEELDDKLKWVLRVLSDCNSH